MKKRAFFIGARYLLGGFAAVLLAVLVFALQDDGPRFSAWSEPVNLGKWPAGGPNGPLSEWFQFTSKDGLSLYFTADFEMLDNWDIYVSQRASVDDPWGPPQKLGPEINTPYIDGGPCISTDGHLMYFASNRPEGFGSTDIYVSRRHNKRDDFGWQTPINLGPGVNTVYNESSPEIFEDDDTGIITLYFDSNRPDGPGPYDDIYGCGNDIWASILQPDEAFGPAVLVQELSSTYRDMQPSIRRDGLEIFFASSNRPGGLGNRDLWTSTRPTTSDPWSAPVHVEGPVNTPGREEGPSLSWDGTKLYFCAIRPDSGGYIDLYVSTRTKLTGPQDEK